MRRITFALAVSVLLLAAVAVTVAQDPSDEPADVDKTEKVDVDLLLIDTLVLDKQERTVIGLTKEDFEMTIDGMAVSVDTFDVFCPEGGLVEPVGVKAGETRPLAPDLPRRVVIVVDYYNTRIINRAPVLNQAQAMIYNGKTNAEEIMIVALADGVRIEQPFSRSKNQALATLQRMEYDVTLYTQDFGGASGESFFKNLSTLMDVLDQYDGTKAVVMFSEFQGGGSRSWDIWYSDVSQRAAMARAPMYTVEAYGMSPNNPVGGSGGLARFANETGGRHTYNTNDLSLGYARAQRDMTCRYTLGHYLEAGEGQRKKSVRVRVTKEGIGQVRYPEQIRLWNEKELTESRLRAAHADPGPFDSPLIRTYVEPLRPSSATKWDTLVALHFPVPVEAEGIDIDAGATLLTGAKILDQYGRRFHVDPAPEAKGEDRPVTLMAEGKIKAGDYRLNIVLSRPDKGQPYTSTAIFTVPEVEEGKLTFHGPVLARAVPDGVLLRAPQKGKKKQSGPSPLEQIIGPDASFEPLMVYMIDSDDLLLAAWSACIVGGSLPSGATVSRQVLAEDGTVVHELAALDLEGPAKGKVRCHEELDSLPAGTLKPGEYTLHFRITDSGSNELISESVPLMVN